MTFVRVSQDVGSADFDPEPGAWYVPTMAGFMSVGLTAPPVLFGLYIGARRRLMESLRERADSLEQELSLLADRAEQRAQWARTEERTRIAREMHDVVAHRVSLMVVHAAALQAVALKDPQKAVKNAALVGDMGRQALTELREMLGVLRAGDRWCRGGWLRCRWRRWVRRRLRRLRRRPRTGRVSRISRIWWVSRGRRGWWWSWRCRGRCGRMRRRWSRRRIAWCRRR